MVDVINTVTISIALTWKTFLMIPNLQNIKGPSNLQYENFYVYQKNYNINRIVINASARTRLVSERTEPQLDSI